MCNEGKRKKGNKRKGQIRLSLLLSLFPLFPFLLYTRETQSGKAAPRNGQDQDPKP